MAAASRPPVGPLEALATSSLMTVLYVALLYLPFNRGPRDSRVVITRRLLTLTLLAIANDLYLSGRLSTSLYPSFLAYFSDVMTRGFLAGLLHHLTGCVIAVFLTSLLYAGHLYILAEKLFTTLTLSSFRRASHPSSPSQFRSSSHSPSTVSRLLTVFTPSTRHLQAIDIIALRNYVVAPWLEEIVFRRQTLLLWRCISSSSSSSSTSQTLAMSSPATQLVAQAGLFAAAHLHHGLRLGWVALLFQLAYTFLFGVYAGALYVNLHTVCAPYAAHVVCNLLEVPDFAAIAGHPRVKPITVLYAACITAFAFLFGPLTTSSASTSTAFV